MIKTTTFDGATILLLNQEDLAAAIKTHLHANAPSVLSGTQPIDDLDISMRSSTREIHVILHPLQETEAPIASADPSLSEASIAWCAPVRDASGLRPQHVRALIRARKIDRADAAIFLLPDNEAERDATRARIFQAWQAAQELDSVCSIHWKTYPHTKDPHTKDAPIARTTTWGRAVVVLHGDEPREIHGTADSQDRRRECVRAEQWAIRNNLLVVRDNVAESDAIIGILGNESAG